MHRLSRGYRIATTARTESAGEPSDPSRSGDPSGRHCLAGQGFLHCKYVHISGVPVHYRPIMTTLQRHSQGAQGSLFEDEPPAAALPADTVVDQDVEAPLAHLEGDREKWLSNPVGAFAAWKASETVHNREYLKHSLDQYTSMFGRYMTWLTERGLRLQDAKSEHLDLFLCEKQSRSAKGASAEAETAAPSTKRRYLQLLNKVYTHLRVIELTKSNPAAPLLDLTKHQAFIKPPPRALNVAQQEAYVEACLALHRQVESADQRASSGTTDPGHLTGSELAPRWVVARDLALRLVFLATGITVHEMQQLTPEDVIIQADPLTPGQNIILLNVAAHHGVKARLAPVAPFATDALLAWRDHLRRVCLNPKKLFPGRRVGINFDELLDHKAISASEAYLCVQPVLEQVAPGPRQGPQTLRNSFMLRQIYEGAPFDRIMAWTGLERPESLHRIKMMVPVRLDGVRPV